MIARSGKTCSARNLLSLLLGRGCWGLCLLSTVAPLYGAEVFVLKTGGHIQGDWINRSESPRVTFVMRTAAGGEIAFKADQVEQVIEQSKDELLYEKLRPTTPDTVEGHEKLADWCLDHKLLSQRHTHLERILQLDPNHAVARSALGYTKSHGEWMTREDFMNQRGMIKSHGHWQTPQEIQLAEEERRGELAVRQWQGRMKRWRAMLNTDKANAAVAEIRAIKDPHAVTALANYLQQDEPRAFKLLLLETIGQISSSSSLKVLTKTSLADPDQEVRLSALDAILKMKNSGNAVNFYISALHSKNNVEVNLAAQGLQALGDPAAIEPLFDALVTEHKFKVVSGPANQTSSTFGTGPGGGGGGMTFGSKPPQIFVKHLRNPEVLVALVKLTGQNYGYEIADWKRWYAARQRAADFSARRD
jgi:hypothetical protein